jgi:hypothetical protein
VGLFTYFDDGSEDVGSGHLSLLNQSSEDLYRMLPIATSAQIGDLLCKNIQGPSSFTDYGRPFATRITITSSTVSILEQRAARATSVKRVFVGGDVLRRKLRQRGGMPPPSPLLRPGNHEQNYGSSAAYHLHWWSKGSPSKKA